MSELLRLGNSVLEAWQFSFRLLMSTDYLEILWNNYFINKLVFRLLQLPIWSSLTFFFSADVFLLFASWVETSNLHQLPETLYVKPPGSGQRDTWLVVLLLHRSGGKQVYSPLFILAWCRSWGPELFHSWSTLKKKKKHDMWYLLWKIFILLP